MKEQASKARAAQRGISARRIVILADSEARADVIGEAAGDWAHVKSCTKSDLLANILQAFLIPKGTMRWAEMLYRGEGMGVFEVLGRFASEYPNCRHFAGANTDIIEFAAHLATAHKPRLRVSDDDAAKIAITLKELAAGLEEGPVRDDALSIAVGLIAGAELRPARVLLAFKDAWESWGADRRGWELLGEVLLRMRSTPALERMSAPSDRLELLHLIGSLVSGDERICANEEV